MLEQDIKGNFLYNKFTFQTFVVVNYTMIQSNANLFLPPCSGLDLFFPYNGLDISFEWLTLIEIQDNRIIWIE